jgi:polysaccharide export outer membrane protein
MGIYMVYGKLTRFGAIIVIATGLAACAAKRGGNIAYGVPNFTAPDAPQAIVNSDSYKLAPLDTITVTVFQVPELSREYVIDLGGNLTMPLIGSTSAIGLSSTELSGVLQRRLAEKYLANPNVTIALKESATRVITVDGSVRQPGVFQATRPLTLLQAVSLARGTDELANPRRVAVFRTIGGKRMAAAFDLVDIRRGKEADPAVYAGDVVVVDGSAIKQIQREILQNLPVAGLFAFLP